MILLNEYPELKKELINHVEDLKADGVLNEDNVDEWHYHAFNETPYLIGYFTCKEWLKNHGIDPFEAIEHCITFEQDELGELIDPYRYTNAEDVVNMLVYTLGYQMNL